MDNLNGRPVLAACGIADDATAPLRTDPATNTSRGIGRSHGR